MMQRKGLWFCDCMQIDDKVWFAAGNYNGLYCYNMAERKVDWIADFPDELFSTEQLFWWMRKYKDNLIFIPVSGKSVYMFNIPDKLFTKIEIPQIKQSSYRDSFFADGRVYGKYLYLFGHNYYGLLRVDLESGKIERMDEMLTILRQETALDVNKPVFCFFTAVVESKVYLPALQSNHLIEFDMESGQYQFYEVGGKDNRYYGVYRVDDMFVLLSLNKGSAVFWNMDSCEEVTYCTECPLDKQVCVIGSNVWILPSSTKTIYRIDSKNKEVKEFFIDNMNDNENDIPYVKDYEGKLYFCNTKGDWFRISDERQSGKEMEKIQQRLEEPRPFEDLTERVRCDFTGKKLIAEKEIYNIEDLIKSVSIHKNNITVGNSTQTGRIIYENVCSALKG